MLWLEGEDFANREEFLAKVERVIKFQNAESHQPTASNHPPIQPLEKADESDSDGDGWTSKTKKPKKPKAQFVRLTVEQLAAAIVDGCLKEMKRVYSYTGPSLNISECYPQFDKHEFTLRMVLKAIREECMKLPQSASARYWADGGAGKGNNFNFKHQKKDTSKPNEWSAAAQIHVIWQ
jgi:hypothetical protein